MTTFQLYRGDAAQVLRGMAANSIDSVVCDPPYGISFMNKHWDYDIPSQPALLDMKNDAGQTVPAILVFTKRGQIFALDRRTARTTGERIAMDRIKEFKFTSPRAAPILARARGPRIARQLQCRRD